MKNTLKEKISFLRDFQNYNNGYASTNSHIPDKIINNFIYTKTQEKPEVTSKSEKHKLINKEFYKYFDENFGPLGGEKIFEDGGRVILYLYGSKQPKEILEYHQSRHDLFYTLGCSSQTKTISNELQLIINNLWLKYKL